MGRWPRPDMLPPWEFVRGHGRYDLPGREARVVYLAETAVTAYLERAELRALRPDLALARQLAEMRETFGADDPDVTAEILEHAGQIGAEWFTSHGLATIKLRAGQKMLDLRDAAILEQLRVLMAAWLLEHGFVDFQFRDLLDDVVVDDLTTLPITQHISSLAYASGFAGIAYLSRLNPTETCWAIYEGAAIESEATILPVSPADADVQRAFAIYSLRAAPDAAADLAGRLPHVVDTGGVVRGFEAASSDISELKRGSRSPDARCGEAQLGASHADLSAAR